MKAKDANNSAYEEPLLLQKTMQRYYVEELARSRLTEFISRHGITVR